MVLLYKKLEIKAKPIIANPKANIGVKTNVDEAETIKNANESVQDLLKTLKSREEDETYQCQPQKNVEDKFINKTKMPNAKLYQPH
jgi:membrane-bound inhibitor of C-type lysozyme